MTERFTTWVENSDHYIRNEMNFVKQVFFKGSQEMWEIETSELKDGKSVGQVSLTVQQGQTAEIRPKQQGCVLGTAIATQSKPPQFILVLKSCIGARCNGKALSLPLVVLDEAGAQLTIKQSGHRFALKINYSYSPGLSSGKPDPNGNCPLCHNPLGLGQLSHCHCGCWFHSECLVPIGTSTECPLCRGATLVRSAARGGVLFPSDLNCQQSQINRRIADLTKPPGPTIIVVGCGSIGSKLIMQLPLVGARRIILIDFDRINSDRNASTCSIFASDNLHGHLKVETLSKELQHRFPNCEVVCLAKPLAQVDPATLIRFNPAILVGAVDNRDARRQIAQLAQLAQPDMPFVDLAISGSPNQLVARVRSTWQSIDGINHLHMWSAMDLQLLEQNTSCSRSQDSTSNVVSGILAAALGIQQIQKILAANFSDVGFETRIDLKNLSLTRCRLGAGSSPTSNGSPDDLQKLFCARRRSRIQHDAQALEALAHATPWLSVACPNPNMIILKFADTPGLMRTDAGRQVWCRWRAVILLTPGFPVLPPHVLLSPDGRAGGQPFHPNIMPHSPFRVCFGRHLPQMLLDELAHRLHRIITLTPGSVMTDERDSLNPEACRFVRKLARSGRIPLSKETHLASVTVGSRR